jgi:hypothetical protein
MAPNRNAPQVGVPHLRAAYLEREAGDTARRARFVASDESVDRYGDVIRASGWQLDSYRKNPVLLFGHQNDTLPVGTVEPIAVEGTKLIAFANFLPEGTTAFADSVWKLVESDVLRAVSVGFLPLAAPNPIYDADKHLTGFEFIAQELLELSVVPVPANPNALQLAKSYGLTPAEMRCLFDDGTAARVAAAARDRSITLSRLGRHRAAPTPNTGA